MAQLNDTMVQGDLRVTGKIYGTENAIRVENANLAIPPLGVGDSVGSTGDFFLSSGSGKNLPDNVNNFNIHTTVTHYATTTYRLSQIATPTSSSNPSGIYERGASSSDGVTWTFGSWLAAASSSHTHGNIQNGGTLQTNDITIANGDKLVVTDTSDSNKVARASISFDGSTTTQALTKAGTWATFNNYSHPAGSAPSKTGVPTANATPGFGGTFKVNQITTDSTSHVSAVTERTITIPNATATTSAAGLMSAADKTKLDGIAAGTASPLMDGKASVGNSLKYAREDHVHPSDTSREDKANKTTVVLGTSDSKYPTDKAVAEFVNSSIATNTANYISNNGEPFTSVEQLEAYSGPVTNNDYAFVTGIDSEGNTYYDRYKATVSGETVTWSLEYRLNNSSFTAAQWSAINSGITSALVAKIHEHENKAVLDGITSSDVANWNSKQNSLTAGDNITIDGNTISSDQVFVATSWTTTYQEIKDAYDAGKMCIVRGSQRYYYITEITTEYIKFASVSPNPNIHSLTVTRDNKWSTYSPWLQTHLTFDDEPTAGSKNPVTSDGIKSAISNSVDQTYSSKSTKAQSGVAVNEAFKTRETSTSDDSYTYLGMSKLGAETEKLYWKLVSFKPKADYWTLQFEMDVSNGRKGERSFDSNIYETKRLTIYGGNKATVSNGIDLRYTSQSNTDFRGYGNNIYYEMDSSKTVTIYIYAQRTPNTSQICRLTCLRNLDGIDNLTWYQPVSDAGTQPINPIKFKEEFPAISSLLSDIGSDSVPVYINKGKPVSCNSSNLKAGKDDDGNVIKNTYQKKLTFDTTPTAGSNNPVTSGGIKTAIDTVGAKGIVINKIDGENVICFE